MAEMDLNNAEKSLKERGVLAQGRSHEEDAESTWIKVDGEALPGPGVLRAEVRGGICPAPTPGVGTEAALGPGGIPALSAKPLLTQAGLNLDLQGHSP